MLWSKRLPHSPDLYNSTNPDKTLFQPRRPSYPTPTPVSTSPILASSGSISISTRVRTTDSRSSMQRPVTSPESVLFVSIPSSSEHSHTKSMGGRQVPSSGQMGAMVKLSQTPGQPGQHPSSGDLADPHTIDLYTYNSLNSFSFGTAGSSSSVPSQTVDPLSVAPSDTDSIRDEPPVPSDITPRPSVVAYAQPNLSSVRSHPSQPSGQAEWPPPRRPRPPSPADHNHRDTGPRDPERASRRTTGTSSASASATSLSSSSGDYSRTDSRASRHTNSTTETSAQELSSNDDEQDHRHPIPHHIPSDTALTQSTTVAGSSGTDTARSTSTAFEFSSDEEYGFEDDDSEDDNDYGYYEERLSIEIGSAQFEGSIAGHDWERQVYAYESGSGSSLRNLSYGTLDRRGSLPLVIPETSSDTTDRASYGRNRDREDSFATVRRPSRSLDDEFQKVGLITPRGQDPAHLQAPKSLPGEGDWKSLEKEKGKGKGKETSIPSPQPRRAPPIPPPSNRSGPTLDDFDSDWSALRGGITTFDRSQIGDILRPRGSVGSVGTLQPSPTDARRPSATSFRFRDLFSNGRRPSTATVSSINAADSFGKAIGSWGGDGYQAQRRDWSFRRERIERSNVPAIEQIARPSISTVLSPRDSIMTDRTEATIGNHSARPSTATDKDRDKLKDKDATKDVEKAKSVAWRGMPIGSVELWRNDLVGRFRVARRTNAHPSKGLQQRLAVVHLRDSRVHSYSHPCITIHKHSKAIAFSISRYYKSKEATQPRSHDPHAVKGSSPGDADADGREKRVSSMTLLAPRRVQEAYTSTNTTRKLESHGLLDDRGLGSGSGNRNKDRSRGYRERAGDGERHRDHTASGSSITLDHTRPPPASAPPGYSYPPSYDAPPDGGREALLASRAIGRNSSRKRRKVRDPLDPDDDDEDGSPARTPHYEAYGTVDATTLEQLRTHDRLHHSDGNPNANFFRRLIPGRSNNSAVGPILVHFDPPWLKLASRNKQEQQQRVVDNLNTSFKDVGLLPSSHKDKSKHSPSSQKQKKIASGNNNAVDIFQDIPSDSLYMLLPLWPGHSDPNIPSESIADTIIPNEFRQYLLVYYKPPESNAPDEHTKSRHDGESKKRSRTSPTSSHESTRREERTSILLTSFHISARLVSHRDLQGSGVRIPDSGLIVSGTLAVAFATMPPPMRDEGLYDWVIGVCHSRDTGIEFYPDGLIKMGLCIQTSPPVMGPRSEEEELPEPEVQLTPIGRAVLEMAWLGGMALTSFGPGM